MTKEPPGPNVAEAKHLLLRPSVWVAVLRQALPVLGVFLYGWPVVQASVLFLTDLWLATTLRDSMDLSFGQGGPRTWSPAAAARSRALAGNLVFFGVLYGLVIGAGVFGHLAIGFPKAEWREFVASAWRSPAFLASLAAIVASHAWDAARYLRHLAERTDSEALADDAAAHANKARLILVVLGTLFVPLPSALGYGGHALVVVIALVNLALELFPVPVSRKLGLTP